VTAKPRSFAETGMKQGCILSLFLFSLRIDRVMKNGTKDQRDIRWALSQVLSDLDFADDRCLLAHRHTDMQAMIEDY